MRTSAATLQTRPHRADDLVGVRVHFPVLLAWAVPERDLRTRSPRLMDDFSRSRPNRLDETPPEARSRARVLRRLKVLGAGRWHAPLGRRAGARVLVVCGQAGAGKSTVAANL